MRKLILAVSTALTLAACGGGGDSGGTSAAPPPTQTTPIPPVVSNPPPTASGSDLTAPEARSRIMAAAAAAGTPAPGTTEPLPIRPGARVTTTDIQHFIALEKTDTGKYFGMSNASGTQLVDPASVQKICFNSFETGWAVGGRTPRACAPIDPATGYGEVPANSTCNRAVGTWSIHLVDGTILWSDTMGDRQWAVDGLPVIRHTDPTDPLYGLVEYGVGGRKQPTISSAVNNSKVDVTVDFGSNCLGGFGYQDAAEQGYLVDFMPVANTYWKFLWNSDEEGWGIVQVGDRRPSTKEAYPVYDAVSASYKVTFTGIKCATRGQITAYRGTGPTDSVVWDSGLDYRGEIGYGAGWFAIQRNPAELQLWVAQAPVVFERDLYQIVLTACTAG